ncbi:Pol Polyprotein [Phytophthora megakarya]|uniref:Pol Polyprotein n=1 Tax=Phytophthora megakarya TaxID=4795 RepID=A0A225UZQ0_9STRA|nr:Pol Polyprotein [Phytophthora megakarya]
MLLGFEVVVHTDHKNLIYPTENNLRVKRWKFLLSEYRRSLHYIQGAKNIGEDAFTRMRFESNQQPPLEGEIYAADNVPECVMHGPVIRDHQAKDETIQKIKTACLTGDNNPDYKLMSLLGCTLVAYHGRVIIPESLREDLVDWYHQNQVSERQFKTMRQALYWPNMETFIAKQLKKCLVCKRAKVHDGKQDYGLLPQGG